MPISTTTEPNVTDTSTSTPTFDTLLRTLMGAGAAFMAHPGGDCSISLSLDDSERHPYSVSLRHKHTSNHGVLQASRDEQIITDATIALRTFMLDHPNALFHPQCTVFLSFHNPILSTPGQPDTPKVMVTVCNHTIAQNATVDAAADLFVTLVHQCNALPVFGDRMFLAKAVGKDQQQPPFQAASPEAAGALHVLLTLGGTNKRKFALPRIQEFFPLNAYDQATLALITQARASARKAPL